MSTTTWHSARETSVYIHGIGGRWERQDLEDRSLAWVAVTALPLLPGVVEDVCVMEAWNPEKAASWNQAPKLHYRLDYDQQKAELFVTRLEGITFI